MLTTRWKKSERSNANGACVEVRMKDGDVQVRDTKDKGKGPILSFTAREWVAFTAAAKDGQFDLPT